MVTASDLIAMAAFSEGRHAQAFPSFGSERTGAPVVAYCRISDNEIRTREPVLKPDLVIVQDPTLLTVLDPFSGLSDDGYALINSTKRTAALGLTALQEKQPPGHFMTLPATDIAREHTGRTVPNAVLLGGMAALTGLIRMDSVAAAIMKRFPGPVGEKNVAAARAAYDMVLDKKRRVLGGDKTPEGEKAPDGEKTPDGEAAGQDERATGKEKQDA